MFSYFTSPSYWMMLLYSIPAVLLALSIHEYSHAFAAYRRGDPTARNLGRMTLDPVKHLDPIGLICLLLFRFGWAKPVPVNSNFKHPKKDNIIVSLSGIIANFILSFIAAAVLFIAIGTWGYKWDIHSYHGANHYSEYYFGDIQPNTDPSARRFSVSEQVSPVKLLRLSTFYTATDLLFC